MIKKDYVKNSLAKAKQFIKLKILHVNDSPHRIALGAALGAFVSFMPTFGLHIITVIAVTLVLRANKLVALITVWLTNPFTIIPAWIGCYLVGRFLVNLFYPSADNSRFEQIISTVNSIGYWQACFDHQFQLNLFKFLWEKSFEFCLGTTVVGLIVGAIFYLLTYFTVVWYRKTHPHLPIPPVV